MDLRDVSGTGIALDVLVTGTPGRLLRWTCELAAAAASIAAATVEHAYPGPDDVWAGRAEGEGQAVRIHVAPYLGAGYAAAVREGRLRTVMAIGAPADCLPDLCDAGSGIVAAVRHLAACAVPLGELAGHPDVLVVSHAAGHGTAAILAALLAHCGWTLPEPDAAALVARFDVARHEVARFEVVGTATPVGAVAPLPAGDAALAQAVLDPAFHYAATGIRRPTAWPRACLLWGDHPDQPAPRVLALTGPARVLVYGPYFALPAGRWTVRATLAFSANCRGAPMAIELHGNAMLARCRFVVGHPGVFVAGFRAVIPSARESLEMRLVSERGAIEGTLGLDGLAFSPEAE